MTEPRQPSASALTTASRQDASVGSKRYLTIEELATATTLSVSTLRRLLKKKLIAGHQPGGPRHRVVFPTDAIEQVIQVTRRADADEPEAKDPSPAPMSGPRPKWMGGPKPQSDTNNRS